MAKVVLLTWIYLLHWLQVTKEKLLEETIEGHVLGEATLMAIFWCNNILWVQCLWLYTCTILECDIIEINILPNLTLSSVRLFLLSFIISLIYYNIISSCSKLKNYRLTISVLLCISDGISHGLLEWSISTLYVFFDFSKAYWYSVVFKVYIQRQNCCTDVDYKFMNERGERKHIDRF